MQLIRETPPWHARVAFGVAGVVGVTLAAEVLVRSVAVNVSGLPLPSAVGEQTVRLLSDAAFLDGIWFTVREWMLGVLIATVAGVLLGGLMGAFPVLFAMLELPVEILRPLPSVAIGPLLVLILGAGVLPLALTVAIACLWPILFNAMYGVRATDPVAVQTGRTLHLSPLAISARIRIPNALPFVFTGIRVAASIGLIVAVSAELLFGSGAGIGGYILVESTTAANLDVVYAATLVAGVLGVLVSASLALVDRYAFPWKQGLAQ